MPQEEDIRDIRLAIRDLQGDGGMYGVSPPVDMFPEMLTAMGRATDMTISVPPVAPVAAPILLSDARPPGAEEFDIGQDDGRWIPTAADPEPLEPRTDPMRPHMMPDAEDVPHNLLSTPHSDTTEASAVLGDLIRSGATGVWSRYGIGNPGEILTVVGGLPVWTALATAVGHSMLDGSIHTDSTAVVVTRGSLIYGNATPKWAKLTIGAATHILTSNGTDFSWAAPVTQTSTLLDGSTHTDTASETAVRGDLIVGNATPAWDRLAKGTAKQVLTMNAAATDPEWAPARTGDVVLWGGTIANIPADRLHCNGAAVSRTTYANLFAFLGTVHGVGDGSTTFNLPDITDVYPVGATEDEDGVPKTNITDSLTTDVGGGTIEHTHDTHATHATHASHTITGDEEYFDTGAVATAHHHTAYPIPHDAHDAHEAHNTVAHLPPSKAMPYVIYI